MASEAGGISRDSPRPGRGSSVVASDDEISVIAVIKKGTSGIPKRARYHYIRELPLTSVKSLKNSLQKSAKECRGLIAAAESSKTSSSRRVVADVKKPRVIELGDEASKMELRKQFKMAETEDPEGDKEPPFPGGGISTPPDAAGTKIVHKLPPGTVLIKQEPKTPRGDNPGFPIPESRPNRSGCNTNGSSAGATTTTSSGTSSSASSSASSVSSCGSGSSSGGFGSGSPSPAKVKRIHRAPKGGGRKKILDVVPRRNPKRSAGSKKGATATEVAVPITTTTATMTTRPRQRLLATRRQERSESAGESAGGVRRTKPATMPYMNTRSVTRKLYTVGATYQAPTRKDETEWREWPVHGLHERPVFHPQVGIAAEYVGRVFCAALDSEGGNRTYREVLDGPEEVEVVPVDPRPKRTSRGPESSEEPFDVCMHESLHEVLAYCAQVMAPSYRRAVAKKRRLELLEACPEQNQESDFRQGAEAEAEARPLERGATQLNLTELEDSSISDEALMEMSSIYKNLLPIEDSPSGTPEGSPTLRIVKGVEDGSATPKNASEASEIARILSEYNESLKESGTGTPFSSTIPVASLRATESRDCGEAEPSEKITRGGKTIGVVEKSTEVPKLTTGNRAMGEDHWLEELLVDTSLLYCVATGVGQRDLTRYVDSLDAKQSLQWLRSRDG